MSFLDIVNLLSPEECIYTIEFSLYPYMHLQEKAI